jgi:hypothetical protein
MSGSAELAFEDLRLPRSVSDLPRRRENRLRVFYVDGREVQIPRDGIESVEGYEYRCSWALARSSSVGARLDELILNSRIAANKRWSPIVRDDETGAYVRTPSYSDVVEERYARARDLPAMDAALERRGIEGAEGAEALYYEPESEREGSETREERAVTKSAEKEAKEDEGIEREPLPAPSATVSDVKSGRVELRAAFAIYVTEPGGTVRRRVPELSRQESAALLAAVYETYSGKLSSSLGNLGRPRFELVPDEGLVFTSEFASRDKAEQAMERLSGVLGTVKPVRLRRGARSLDVHYSVAPEP